MGHADDGSAGALRLLHQKGSQTPVQPPEEDLLHGPHHVGKPRRCLLIEKAAYRKLPLTERRDHARGNNEKRGIFCRRHVRLKCDLADDAGGGKYAAVPCVKPEQRDLPSFFRKKIGPYLPLQQQQHPQTLILSAVDQAALGVAAQKCTATQRLLLLFRKILPERDLPKVFF